METGKTVRSCRTVRNAMPADSLALAIVKGLETADPGGWSSQRTGQRDRADGKEYSELSYCFENGKIRKMLLTPLYGGDILVDVAARDKRFCEDAGFPWSP
ncbi:MAG: hypothetical protein ACI4OJ_04570, partial [Lachnospiraceae bacterium]